jgi:hypothetical protein
VRVAVALAVVTLAALIFARTPVGARLDLGVFADVGSSHFQLAPVIVVTKSEITYEGKLVGDLPVLPDATTSITCTSVVEKLKRAVASYDATLGALVGTKAPMVLGSCLNDHWPESLKECIVAATPEELVGHRCDVLVPDELAQKLLDRLAPGQRLSPRDFLRR